MNDDLTNIIHAVKRGDESAFRQLIERYYRYVHRIGFRVLLDSDGANDVAQETFVKVWQYIGTFNMNLNFTTWLYRIASNSALDMHRSMKRRKVSESYLTDEAGSDNDPFKQTEAQEMQSLVVHALRDLPPVQRLVLALRDFEDLSVSDVVICTGLSTASVKTNLSYARRKIRKILSRDFDIQGTDS